MICNIADRCIALSQDRNIAISHCHSFVRSLCHSIAISQYCIVATSCNCSMCLFCVNVFLVMCDFAICIIAYRCFLQFSSGSAFEGMRCDICFSLCNLASQSRILRVWLVRRHPVILSAMRYSLNDFIFPHHET